MLSCAVSTCKNTSTTCGDSGVIFHPFPRNDKEALTWFIKCRRYDKKRPNATDRICSDHFQSNDYERDLPNELMGQPPNPKLKCKATPTRNLPYIYIKPTEARKMLPPSLARQLSRSELQKGNGGKKLTGPAINRRNSLSISESRGAHDGRRVNSDGHCRALLTAIFADPEFTDIVLVTENRSLKAHKAVLIQASSYFKKLLDSQEGSAAATGVEVRLENIEFQDLMSVITFIYCGEVYVQESNLGRFREAAKALEIDSLLEQLDRMNIASGSTTTEEKERESHHARLRRTQSSDPQYFRARKNKFLGSELKSGLVSALLLLY